MNRSLLYGNPQIAFSIYIKIHKVQLPKNCSYNPKRLHYHFFIFGGGLECVDHSFAYVAHFVFLRDVWIRDQRAAVASRRATNLATHLPN
jgi:hypothetical protein